MKLKNTNYSEDFLSHSRIENTKQSMNLCFVLCALVGLAIIALNCSANTYNMQLRVVGHDITVTVKNKRVTTDKPVRYTLEGNNLIIAACDECSDVHKRLDLLEERTFDLISVIGDSVVNVYDATEPNTAVTIEGSGKVVLSPHERDTSLHALAVSIRGDGRVVGSVAVDELYASINGGGDIFTFTVINYAHLTVVGSGEITVTRYSVSTTIMRSVSGNGHISIH